MNWYYANAGQKAGPIEESQLDALRQAGQINDETLVWCEGMANWQPYGKVRQPAPPGTAAQIPGAGGSGATTSGINETVCAECGRIFPIDSTIQFGEVRVCAGCKPIFMQKLAEGAKIGGGLSYAKILTRFGAVFLDGIILAAMNMLLGFTVGGLTFMQAAGAQPADRVGVQIGLFFLQLTIGISYEVIMIGKYGATLGKMAAKIKVVTAEGGKVTYSRALGRYFAKMLSAAICGIGYIMAAFDEEKRALHDRICNTRVITK